MILWHPELLPYLPHSRLLSLHRDVCLLRGRGWGKGGPELRYVWLSNLASLAAYHLTVMHEMERRHFKPSRSWKDACWRGPGLPRVELEVAGLPIPYPDHNGASLWAHSMALVKLLARPTLWKAGEADKFTHFIATRFK